MSNRINIHLTPENFPRFTEAVAELTQTMMQEADAYCESHNLPPAIAISIFSGLCLQIENEFRSQKEFVLQEVSPNQQIEHCWLNEDGTSSPMQSADISPVEPPINLN